MNTPLHSLHNQIGFHLLLLLSNQRGKKVRIKLLPTCKDSGRICKDFSRLGKPLLFFLFFFSFSHLHTHVTKKTQLWIHNHMKTPFNNMLLVKYMKQKPLHPTTQTRDTEPQKWRSSHQEFFPIAYLLQMCCNLSAISFILLWDSIEATVLWNSYFTPWVHRIPTWLGRKGLGIVFWFADVTLQRADSWEAGNRTPWTSAWRIPSP